jgi:hypothetical protein
MKFLSNISLCLAVVVPSLAFSPVMPVKVSESESESESIKV